MEAYLASVPAEQRARSDAYFEGGYWLRLWDFLSTTVVMWVLLRFRWSARMRDVAECASALRPLQSVIVLDAIRCDGRGDHFSAHGL